MTPGGEFSHDIMQIIVDGRLSTDDSIELKVFTYINLDTGIIAKIHIG